MTTSTSVGDKIKQLRAEGKSYNQIVKEVGCSKSTVCYHCGEGQKAKNAAATKRLRSAHSIVQRVERFKGKKRKNALSKIRDFRRRKGSHFGAVTHTYTWKDVLERLGPAPVCYITGEPIDLQDPKSYTLDHFVSSTKGGDNSLDNLRVCKPYANMMKTNLSFDEFLSKCRQILEFHGYQVQKDGGG